MKIEKPYILNFDPEIQVRTAASAGDAAAGMPSGVLLLVPPGMAYRSYGWFWLVSTSDRIAVRVPE